MTVVVVLVLVAVVDVLAVTFLEIPLDGLVFLYSWSETMLIVLHLLWWWWCLLVPIQRFGQ